MCVCVFSMLLPFSCSCTPVYTPYTRLFTSVHFFTVHASLIYCVLAAIEQLHHQLFSYRAYLLYIAKKLNTGLFAADSYVRMERCSRHNSLGQIQPILFRLSTSLYSHPHFLLSHLYLHSHSVLKRCPNDMI